LLKYAAGITEPTPFAELDLEAFGYSEIKAAETLWVEEDRACGPGWTLWLNPGYTIQPWLGKSFIVQRSST